MYLSALKLKNRILSRQLSEYERRGVLSASLSPGIPKKGPTSDIPDPASGLAVFQDLDMRKLGRQRQRSFPGLRDAL